MLQAEDDLLHRESTFANDPRGVEQHEARHQAQYQMPIVTNGVSILQTKQQYWYFTN